MKDDDEWNAGDEECLTRALTAMPVPAIVVPPPCVDSAMGRKEVSGFVETITCS